MLTQNRNECSKGHIWRHCPKTEPTSRSINETSVAMAAVKFNEGPQNFAKILDLLGMAHGSHFKMAANKAQAKRLREAAHAASPAVQQRSRKAKMDKTV